MDLFDVEWRAGNWQLAERYIEDVFELNEDMDDPWGKAELPVKQARLSALQGQVDEARRLVAQGIERAEAIHWTGLAAMNRWVRGFLELSLGEPARAWDSLDDASASHVPALSSLERLEAVAARGNRWAVPAAERAAAVLLVARDELHAAVAAAESAAEGFRAAGFPFDQARALLVAGDALRREGKRSHAAENIQAAKEIFTALGATLWIDRAETELRRASPRPRRDRELTSAERRVAALVASGKTNREVASQLFTSVKTVEAHLTRIYRKLGVRSRTELARRVADGSASLADE
jgi:DNA-binding NarL/FixJ family response regulator